MANLRINTVDVVDSKSIVATFTETLVSNLNETNVNIISATTDVPDATPLKVTVSGNTFSIVCTPLSQFGAYYVVFKSTTSRPFISLHNTARLSEDGISNKYLILGPMPTDNPVRQFLNNYYADNIYDIETSEGLISKYLDGISETLSRTLYDIGQVKNENYISFNTVDELKVRGGGPTDRLNEEGAYQLLRVGRTATDAQAESEISFTNFPFYPVTLQRHVVQESLTIDSDNSNGTFNKIDFILNLSNNPVTRINSVTFIVNTAAQTYEYDITSHGYQILDSRYDQEFGFTYNQITDKQIKLSEKLLEDDNFDVDDVVSVIVGYEYKRLGIVVDADSVVVSATNKSVREVLPPIINVFNLDNHNLVDQFGNAITLGGITFIDPNSNDPNAIHSAFTKEVEFSLSHPPAFIGQYSIDYSTGTVYVYGSDDTKDGTGPYPPLATYYYTHFFQEELDYVYDETTLDFVTLPIGSLRDELGTVTFTYEEVLVPGVDYESFLHSEELGERISNNILSLNAVKVTHSPVTNVFRIYNETSGEVYSIDRWNNDKVYFGYNVPPRIITFDGERVSFLGITNELLFVTSTYNNGNAVSIFKLLLKNNEIISSSEDGIGSFLNTSLFFSDINIFQSERWFNQLTDADVSVDRIETPGEYVVDYVNGVIYLGVSASQNHNIGVVNYKKNSIYPDNNHLVSVNNIYYRLSPLSQIDTTFQYVSFGDSSVVVDQLDTVDEQVKYNLPNALYFVDNNVVGVYNNTAFIPGVTYKIKDIRFVCEKSDMLSSTSPLNFAPYATYDDFIIIINPIVKSTFSNVQFDGSDYYVFIDEDVPYVSANITYTFSVLRPSNGDQLWDGSGTVVPGSPLKLVLSGINTPVDGETVQLDYTFAINDLSNITVDYNKGEFYLDYTYLADEIVVSYEYGDNVIDFRESTTISEGEEYYVTYKSGALRDALLKNFGNLINIPELTNFDITFDRERYRDAVFAGLSSFVQGPTLSAIKNIGKVISHIEPIVEESIFNGWDLGSSLLEPTDIQLTGQPVLAGGRFSDGLLISQNDQTVTFPYYSNIRLEEGTFETFVIPQWDGLDNEAELTFEIKKNGNAIAQSEVFIGKAGIHPTIDAGKFHLTKLNDVGEPNLNKDGVFIYYDKDATQLFSRWYVQVIDGYVNAAANYSIKISTNGTMYDSKFVESYNDTSIFSGQTYTTLKINPTDNLISRKYTFISDIEHYLFDCGKSEGENRVSILKDVNGYLIFRVYDRYGKRYDISHDVSSWNKYDLHFVAASWKLNTKSNADEMHLFVDGFEVPNIYKYGQKYSPYVHEKFRTISSEEVVGLASRDVVGSTDMVTEIGNAVVSSAINFNSYNIQLGDIVLINEVGFDEAGYTIITISGQELTLDSVMPKTLADVSFTINATTFTVDSFVNTASNIVIYRDPVFLTDSTLAGTIGTNVVTSSLDFNAQNILPGYLIRIEDGYSLTTYPILNVSTNQLIIDGYLGSTFSATDGYIYANAVEEIPGMRATIPSYTVGTDGYCNDTVTFINGVFAEDLLLINTLGLNNKTVNTDYYVWSDQENHIIKTHLPPPLSLDEVKVTKIIKQKINIGASNSTLVGGVYQSFDLETDQPSNSQDGRTLSVKIDGTNVDFSQPVTVVINGVSEIYTVSETLTFTDYGVQDFSNLYVSVNYIQVNAKPINANLAAVVVEVKEKYEITYSENSGLVPEIRFSYHTNSGSKLYSLDGYTVTDDYNTFSHKDVGNYLLIHAPSVDGDGYALAVPGFYTIDGISDDRKTLNITSTTASADQPLDLFADGYYTVLNTTDYRSGLQNGYFTFEAEGMPSVPYLLAKGYYEFNYKTSVTMKIDSNVAKAYLGSDLNGTNQFNGVIDQLKVYSVMLTDTRVGESIPANKRSITKDYNSIRELTADENTLMLVDFNSLPIQNIADRYVHEGYFKHLFYSSDVVNENFPNGVCIQDKPLVISNDGFLDTRKEGTIEMWVNPGTDTGNDPNDRYYFDAFGAVIEDTISENNVTVKVAGSVGEVLSIKLTHGGSDINYYDGGRVETDTDRSISEVVTSMGNAIVVVSKPIIQVSTIKIVGDPTNTDYFNGGAVGADRTTIYLGRVLPQNNVQVNVVYQPAENQNDKLNTQVIRLNRKLPNQNSAVTVTYLPRGVKGDRLSIFKDSTGYINFLIKGGGVEHVVKAPTLWTSGSWHRIKASYVVNSSNNMDSMNLFLDGYEYSNILFGQDIVFNKFPTVMGSAIPGDGYYVAGGIKFQDSINYLFVGSAFNYTNPIFSVIDNLRISNISRPIYSPYGESIDVNYSSNLDSVFPVTEDLYTTYLLDLSKNKVKTDDFAQLKNRKTGLFNFLVKIIDSYGIIDSSAKSKETLEKLINVLKPANTRAFIEYIS